MTATAPAWRFPRFKPGDTFNNPYSDEFFATTAKGSPAATLVREAVQNTLDAPLKEPNAPARTKVRICLSEDEWALPSSRVDRWFKSLWPHIDVPENGLSHGGRPRSAVSCRFVTYEDFGTTGLTGDYLANEPDGRQKNDFFNFFRAQGYTDKEGAKQGSWGIGKAVFPRASYGRTYFGLTVRAGETSPLLLGRSILKCHRANDKMYKSDGYWGSTDDQGFTRPVQDGETLEQFREDFRVTRRDGESGLSIVVPWYISDYESAITPGGIITAVAEGFFFPIMLGHLVEVRVEWPKGAVVINADTLTRVVREHAEAEGERATELIARIELAEWALTLRPEETRNLAFTPPAGAQKWEKVGHVEDDLAAIREALSSGSRSSLRIPMNVEPTSGRSQRTHFGVYLERADGKQRPSFIRDELLIPGVKAKQVSGTRALVIVDDEPIAALLRAAETPSHNEWTPATSNFRDKYKFGSSAIEFVTNSVAALAGAVSRADAKPDPSLTVDFFSLSMPASTGDSTSRTSKKPKPGTKSQPKPGDIKGKPKRFRIAALPGGFSLRPGTPGAPPPEAVELRLAYDILRGNPLKSYSPEDFNLNHHLTAQNCSADGVRIEVLEPNRLLVRIEDPEFRFDVTGFDENRDLLVKAQAKRLNQDLDSNESGFESSDSELDIQSEASVEVTVGGIA